MELTWLQHCRYHYSKDGLFWCGWSLSSSSDRTVLNIVQGIGIRAFVTLIIQHCRYYQFDIRFLSLFSKSCKYAFLGLLIVIAA